MQLCSRESLMAMNPASQALIGIDSDGCVFDSMTVKQCVCFHPQIIRTWQLEAIAETVRETASFVNLYSYWRGRNRFEALLKMFRLLQARPCVKNSNVVLPDLQPLHDFVHAGVPPGNPTLAEAVSKTGNPELKRLLQWSLDVNESIANEADGIMMFGGAREALEQMAQAADTMVVSQTPGETLVKEWKQHGIEHLVRCIGGQELGSKTQQLRLASHGRKYPPDKVLMIGDAPGDLEAAREAGVKFYPIVPGRETACWQRLTDDVLSRFLEGTYDHVIESQLIDDFLQALPETPPW